MAYNSETDDTRDILDFNIRCERPGKMSWKENSECNSMKYPNFQIICQNDIDYVAALEQVAEQVAEENLEEDYDEVLKSIYDLYSLNY